jgi:hypothetical protein
MSCSYKCSFHGQKKENNKKKKRVIRYMQSLKLSFIICHTTTYADNIKNIVNENFFFYNVIFLPPLKFKIERM